ncbi:UDP-N-acetylmuramate--L-alanine ligase [Candidatus Collierbacteria bacterium RIFOXYB1_FULL_49_13]|uniref:UDP-N-acetylmuramate--L-alanine ligase n=1 Tax=Candidatus Collierbacteria bacterium RIFOXYB1_FULL_49_13 TaxID=1817728 RepID=A0A1F5FGK8_9BACT|nr:MAG: UDP-N-acetylmuramate--L-alanine ligase [Candidatus Collierbacteria bacterium RIFOXYB1_FULL_49_13]
MPFLLQSNHMSKKQHIHFMGIGGSGVSAVVQIAHHQGYEVSGCDLQTDTPYIEKVKKDGISVSTGHDPKHLAGIDLLAASPAAFFQKPLHPELQQALAEKKAVTWQNFLGNYLHRNKHVICIAGTHGKSTTTAIASLMFEDAGLDPSVVIGATVTRWHNNYRLGNSPYFLTESDEFFDNFLNYHPDTIILNNIEPDHPDYFKSQKQLYQSFAKHLKSLKGSKQLIFSQDSPGIKKLFDQYDLPLSTFSLIGYTLSSHPLIDTPHSLRVTKILHNPTSTQFTINSRYFKLCDEIFTLPVPGDYNVSNALGVIALGLLHGLTPAAIKSSLSQFTGIGRRLELLGTPQNIHIYDDYAHHPTAVKLTLEALKQMHPNSRIFCVIEPHSFSRTKQLLAWYKHVFDEAAEVLITPIFPARDTKTFGISPQHIADVSKHSNITAYKDFDQILNRIKSTVHPGDVVVIMGAGKSYQLSQQILKSLTHDH